MNIKRARSFLAMTFFLVIAVAQCGPAALAGVITYDVTVDTSSLTGVTGSIQYTLIAGNTPAPLDTATITAFTSDATLVPPATTSGDVSGNLPGTVTIDNKKQSLYLDSITYGTFLFYQVTLSSTPGNSSSPDTTFSFYLFDGNGNPISASNSPSGEAFDLNINGQTGATTLVPYYPPPPITVVPESVPEPSSMVLLGVGLGAVVGWGRWRGRRVVLAA